jgi:hypothetical protein
MIQQQFESGGFAGIAQVLSAQESESIATKTIAMDPATAGTRCLLAEQWCRTLVGRLRQHADIAALIPADFVAVQCTYFEKSVERNWLVPVHQDSSIPVATRIDHPALRGWSKKEGSLFVQPPHPCLSNWSRSEFTSVRARNATARFNSSQIRIEQVDSMRRTRTSGVRPAPSSAAR